MHDISAFLSYEPFSFLCTETKRIYYMGIMILMDDADKNIALLYNISIKRLLIET